MSKESRIFSPTVWGAQDTITHYESFGWELLSINGNQITMSRETQNPVYPELVKFQAKYEDLALQLANLRAPACPEPLPPVNFKFAIIGFICLIVPGAIYVAYKVNKKKEFDAAMQEYREKYAAYQATRQQLLEKMKATAADSRAVFFSKQG